MPTWLLATLLVALAVWPPLLLAQAPQAAAATAVAAQVAPVDVVAGQAAPAEIAAALKTPVVQGQGQLRFLGLRVYEATLWRSSAASVATGAAATAATATNWASQPLALDIRYQRGLKGDQIAERSLKEMRRQGDIDDSVAQRWLVSMKALFPDVVDGTRITGVHTPGQGARFYVNGQAKGVVGDNEFARRFFGIWLAPQSSEPALRAALLGQAPP